MPFVPLPGAILRDKTTGAVWHLDIGSHWIVGRSQMAHVQLADHDVARQHCRIAWNETWSIDDLGGANGTWVNGNRIAHLELRDRDALSIGRTVLAFEIGAAPPRLGRPGAEEDLGSALVENDFLDAATALHAYVLEAIAGRRDPDSALRAVTRLVVFGDEALVSSMRDAAIASARDSSEIGLRVTATRILVELAPHDGLAKRALEGMRRDRALEVRHAASAGDPKIRKT